ncbi:MAG: glycoside hydrolase family 3 N-terminal domain-containing protein [Solirubrobacteraceae bacterium]
MGARTRTAWLAAPVAAFAASAGAPAAAAPDATAGLTVRQLVGQRMIYSYAGTRPPAALRTRIARGEAAGVIVFRWNIASRAALAATVRGLQAIPRPPGLRAPLLVMIDQEGGLVKRLPGPPLRSPATLGRIGSPTLARAEGRATALNLRGVGVNVDLAPVVDVGRPGSFQQRFLRSYGSSPARVSAMGSAFAAGLQQRRVAATLKHFPGLGTVRRNEDDVAQRVTLSPAALRTIDEAPFAAGIRAGARLVMTSTAIYPALASRPALLSSAVSTGELRGRLGFRGVAITDDLTTSGLVPFGSPERLGLQAAQAGNDLLLYAGGYSSAARAYESLVRDAQAGRLRLEATRASVRRVLGLRASL